MKKVNLSEIELRAKVQRLETTNDHRTVFKTSFARANGKQLHLKQKRILLCKKTCVQRKEKMFTLRNISFFTEKF